MTWPCDEVVVAGVAAGWIVCVAVAVVPLVVPSVVVVAFVVVVVADVVDPASAVIPVEWPEKEAAAIVPKAPAAAMAATEVPMVIVRSRRTARLRSCGVVRLALFMDPVSNERPCGSITGRLSGSYGRAPERYSRAKPFPGGRPCLGSFSS